MEDNRTQSALRSLLKGGIFSFTGIVVHQIAGFGLKVVFARCLTPEEFGIVNLGLAIMVTITSLSLIGYRQGITRFTAFFNGRGEKGKIKVSIISALKFIIFSGCLAGFLAYVFSENISVDIFHNEELIPVLKIFTFAIPIFALTKILNAALRGLKKIHLMIITENVLWRVLPLMFFLFLFILYDLRAVGAAYSFLFSIIIMCIISNLFVFKEIAHYPKSSDDKTCFREISSFSWRLGLVDIANAVKSRTDIFLLGFFLGTFEIGIFSVALTVSSLLTLFLSSIGVIFNPVASELYSQKNTQEISRIFSLVTKWLFLLVFPLLLFLVFFPKISITTLFGESYKSAGPILVILSLCFFLKTLVGPTGATLLAMGHSQIFMKINVVTIMLTIILNLLLIPKYGAVGAALATGIPIVLQQVSMLFMVKKHINLHLFKKTMPIYAIYCIILVLCIKIYLESYIQGVLSLSLIGIIFYLFALFGITITKQLEDDDLVLINKSQGKMRVLLQFFLKFTPTKNNRNV